MPILVKVPDVRKIEEARLLKMQVCSKYSGKGRAECSIWHCTVRCLDALQIHHIRNDGKSHRGAAKSKGAGINIYRRLRRLEFPEGYRTLCANHHALITARLRALR